MSKGTVRKIAKVGRVVSNVGISGRTYKPRITVSGNEIIDLGWEYNDKVEILTDLESGIITIRKVE